MKRLILLISLLLLSALMLASCNDRPPAETTAENPDGLAFFLRDDGTYAVEIGQARYLSRIVIPATYRGAAVTEIGRFGGDGEEKNTTLTEMVIPDSVTVIGDRAFYRCEALRKVTLGAGVGEIGEEAFAQCKALGEITIPESVEVIGESAFAENSALLIYAEAAERPAGWEEGFSLYYNTALETSLSVPIIWDCRENELASDGALYATVDGLRYALRDGEAAVVRQLREPEELTLPASVTYRGTVYPVTEIRSCAFLGCKELTSVTLGENVEVIGHSAFRDCKRLSSVTLGEGIGEIGGSAFCGCIALTSLTVPESTERIGFAALKDCSLLESLTLPFVGESQNGTENTHLGYLFGSGSSFSHRSAVPHSLEEITVSRGSIAPYAFADCAGLTSVTLGDGVTGLGERAFSGCQSLTSVTLGEGIGEIGGGAFCRCAALTSLVLPRGITAIESGTFEGCTALTALVIPESVKTIGAYAFEDCRALTLYAEAAERPASWVYLWDAVTGHPELVSLPVVFGYTGE